MSPVCLILVISALCGFAMGNGDPTLVVNMLNVTVEIKDNSYISKWTPTLVKAEPLNKLQFDISITQDLPPEFETTFHIKMAGKSIPDYKMTTCEALVNKEIGEGFTKKGNPFPRKCPVLKGEYKIKDYVAAKDNIPPGLPNGPFFVVVENGMPGEEAMMKIFVEGVISHEAPVPGG